MHYGRQLIVGSGVAIALLAGGAARAGTPTRLPKTLTPLDEDCSPPFALRWRGRSKSSWILAFDAAGPRSRHVLFIGPQGVGFFRITGSRSQAVGATETLSVDEMNTPAEWTFRRGRWRAQALRNGRQVAVMYAPACGDTVRASKSLLQQAPRVQPTADLHWADDFMREQRELGEWTMVRGEWRIAGQEDPRQNRSRSSNPFSFAAVTDKTGAASTTAGYWFWGDRRATAAVKPGTADWVAIDLVVGKSRTVSLRWSHTPASGKLQWVASQGKHETVLAERPGGFEPGQWYRVTAELSDGRLIGRIDDGPALTASCTLAVQGEFGLSAHGPPETEVARFDDVELEPPLVWREDFGRRVVGKWRDLTGAWVTDARDAARHPSRAGLSWSLTGESTWMNYRVEATLTLPHRGSFRAGVGVCWDAESRTGYVLQIRSRSRKRFLALVFHSPKKEILLAETSLAKLPRRVRLFLSQRNGHLWGGFPQGPQVEACDARRSRGLCALLADRPEVRVAEVTVRFQRDAPPELRVADQFKTETLMAKWARRQGEWREEDKGRWVYRLPLFGDGEARWELPEVSADTESQLSVTLGGCQAVLHHAAPSSRWRLSSFGGRQPAVALSAAPGDKLSLARRGKFVVLAREGQPLCWRPAAAADRAVSFSLRGGEPVWKAMSVAGAGWLDDTFSLAPVNWYVQRGVWDTMQRWTCGPSWSFFGGTHPVSPVIWTKSWFSGDQVVELFAGTQMDPVRGDVTPTDLNVTLCGDGRDLGSGYSFIYAGLGQKVNRLYRKGRLLAETKFSLIKGKGFSAHTGWFDVRVEKLGEVLRMTVNGKEVLSAVDPDPLPGGRTAFWSYLASPIIARARIAAETRRYAPLPARPVADMQPEPPPPPATLPVRCDFETTFGPFRDRNRPEGAAISLDRSRAASGKQSLRVMNLTSGGDFTVWVLQAPVVCPRLPTISFDYCVPSQVKVNLYVRLNHRWREIGFTAPSPDNRNSLGNIARVATDGRWDHAVFAFDRSQGTSRRFRLPLVIEGLAFSSPADPYLRCGVLGNPVGCVYWLDNFELALPPEGQTTTNHR